MAEEKLATTDNKPATLKEWLGKQDIRERFEALLKDRSAVFMTSIMQIANSNVMLKKADPTSIINAALTAATLDLPLNNSLGYAYIVPFNSKEGVQALFILGAKGFTQLAQRSGQFKTMSYSEVFEGQIVSSDPLQGYVFDFTKKDSEKIVGYAAYFRLLNGFEATWYMTCDQIEKHAKKYSQTYKSGFGNWKDNFDAMAKKTVLKLLLSKFAPLSIEMQTAIRADQSVVKETEDGEFEYVDNQGKEEVDPRELNAELRVLLNEKIEADVLSDELKGRYIGFLEEEKTDMYKKMKKELEALK